MNTVKPGDVVRYKAMWWYQTGTVKEIKGEFAKVLWTDGITAKEWVPNLEVVRPARPSPCPGGRV